MNIFEKFSMFYDFAMYLISDKFKNKQEKFNFYSRFYIDKYDLLSSTISYIFYAFSLKKGDHQIQKFKQTLLNDLIKILNILNFELNQLLLSQSLSKTVSENLIILILSNVYLILVKIDHSYTDLSNEKLGFFNVVDSIINIIKEIFITYPHYDTLIIYIFHCYLKLHKNKGSTKNVIIENKKLFINFISERIDNSITEDVFTAILNFFIRILELYPEVFIFN